MMPLKTRRAPIPCKQCDREKKSTTCQMLYAPLLRANIPMAVSSPSHRAVPLLHDNTISKIAFRQFPKCRLNSKAKEGKAVSVFLDRNTPKD